MQPSALALVLHAHLPFVRHEGRLTALEERWLCEALWESYLPLCAMLERLDAESVPVRLTVSISPTLACMLRDRAAQQTFVHVVNELDALARHLEPRLAGRPEGVALGAMREHLAEAQATWKRWDGDVLGAFSTFAEQGLVELTTTAATHAYLPGLSPSAIRAQLRIGRRLFERLSGVTPVGLWLPECGYEPRLAEDLHRAGVRWTVLDAHGVALARPKPPGGAHQPVRDARETRFLPRDPEATRAVWSRQVGYPGDPSYREFYRDVGFDLPQDELRGHLGPEGARFMTGLKLHRITGDGDHKEAYDPHRARERTREHARHFLEQRAQSLSKSHANGLATPLAVAPYDAELFGHWWFEGPHFLEQVFRQLAGQDALQPVTSSHAVETIEAWPAEPAASSWGEGGYSQVWTHPRAAQLWRHVRHAGRAVERAALTKRHARGTAGRALDQAIRELLCLQGSDWAFMLERGEMIDYATQRVKQHAERALRLAEIAQSANADAFESQVRRAEEATPFARQLEGAALRDAFDEWS